MQAVIEQKSWPILGQIYLSMIEYPKHDWHAAFGHRRLCYRRVTAGTIILNLLYNSLRYFDINEDIFQFYYNIFVKIPLNTFSNNNLPINWCQMAI